MTLQAILYTPPSSSPTSKATLQILDQLTLPHQTTYLPIPSARTAYDAIKRMSVRGAPAIAIVAALAVAVEVSALEYPSNPSAETQIPPESKLPAHSRGMQAFIVGRLEFLLGSRPTAVNLRDAVTKLERVVDGAVQRGGVAHWENAVRGAMDVGEAFVAAAERMLVDDVSDNERIGEEGARWIGRLVGEGKGKVAVLTHCNTGSLATAGYGTALGVVRSLWKKGLLSRAYYTETRPYNQGSRLTGYELIHDGIPATLITDSMAAALFRLKGKSETMAAVVVGADRVAANGDTANKIGTYGLAVLARYHGVKFLVAAPRTTIDLATNSGEDIVIEQRPPEEVLSVKGPRNLGFADGVQTVDTQNVESVSTAAIGTQPWNPSFDVTPAELIDGIVTEVGVVEKDSSGQFDLSSIFDEQQVKAEIDGGQKEMPDPAEGP